MPAQADPRPPVRRCGAPACTVLGTACRWPLDRGPCPHHRDADPAGRCTARVRLPQGIRPREDRCRAWPLAGETVCRSHVPAVMEQRRTEARQRAAATAAHARLKDALAVVGVLLDRLADPAASPGGRVSVAKWARHIRSFGA